MKFTLDLPDWADGRTINVMAGMELVAYKKPGESWRVKTGRCQSCGKCCMSMTGEETFPPSQDGRCEFLVPNGGNQICSLGVYRPLRCSTYVGENPECKQTFGVVENGLD